MLRHLNLFATLYRSLNGMRARHVDRTRARRRQEAGAENSNSLRLLDTVTEHIPVVAVGTRQQTMAPSACLSPVVTLALLLLITGFALGGEFFLLLFSLN